MTGLAVIATMFQVASLIGTRSRLSREVVDGDISFGRAADKLAVHFLFTVCVLQAVWFLWFVIA